MPWRASLLLGAGTMVVGAAAPLYDAYVPPLLQQHLTSSTWIGAAMGIDNVLALILVPIVGAWSDGIWTSIGRRMPFVLTTLPIAAVALSLIPVAARFGLVPLLLAMVVFDAALATWRAPFTALLSELVPSVHRSKTEGILGVAMCIGAMVVLGGASVLATRSPSLPFVLAAALMAVTWFIHVRWLREPAHGRTPQERRVAPARALRDVLTAGGGMAARFLAACLFFNMAFQSFSSWFTLHGSERFHTTVAKASLAFIAVALSTLVGSMPAGWLGARYGRRRVSMVGLAGMVVASLLLHVAPTLPIAVGLSLLFGVSWSMPTANLVPMALELGPPDKAGSISGAFMLVASVSGMTGPAIAGVVFDATDSKRSLFLLIAAFLAVAIAFMATLRQGFGEASSA